MLSFLENQIMIIRLLIGLIFLLSMGISSCRVYGMMLLLVTVRSQRTVQIVAPPTGLETILGSPQVCLFSVSVILQAIRITGAWCVGWVRVGPDILRPRGHGAMSADSCGCHSQEACFCCLVGIANLSSCNAQDNPQNKQLSSPNAAVPRLGSLELVCVEISHKPARS